MGKGHRNWERKISVLLVFLMLLTLAPLSGLQVHADSEGTMKVGDFVLFGKYLNEPILWRVIHIDESGSPTLWTENILCLKAFDAAESGKTETGANETYTTKMFRDGFGSNRWENSNIREWLNSSAKKVKFSSQAPIGAAIQGAGKYGTGYNDYDKEAGFLSGFSAGERSAIKGITHKAILAECDKKEKTDGSEFHKQEMAIEQAVSNFESAYSKNMTDKVYLLDIKELKTFVFDNGMNIKKTMTQKAVDNNENEWVGRSTSEVVGYWLRTPLAEFSYMTRTASMYGNVQSDASNAVNYGIAPALNLLSGKVVSGKGTLEEPYAPVNGADTAVDTAPVKISTIGDISVSIAMKAAFSMPETVTAIMSDGTERAVSVKWNKKLSSGKKGVFKANGTVTGYSKKVVFTLTVGAEAPKVGTIYIPAVTDPNLKMPTDLKLCITQGSAYPPEGGESFKIDHTMPSLVWTNNTTESDNYLICLYDQNKQLVNSVFYSYGREVSATGSYPLAENRNCTINTITVTPVNSVDGSVSFNRLGNEKLEISNNSNDKIGETAVFQCQVNITEKAGKGMKLITTPSEWSAEYITVKTAEKIAPSSYYVFSCVYRKDKKNDDSTAGRGGFSDKDGTFLLNGEKLSEFNKVYGMPNAKNTLFVYSDPVINNDTTASFTITKYPLTIVK